MRADVPWASSGEAMVAFTVQTYGRLGCESPQLSLLGRFARPVG